MNKLELSSTQDDITYETLQQIKNYLIETNITSLSDLKKQTSDRIIIECIQIMNLVKENKRSKRIRKKLIKKEQNIYPNNNQTNGNTCYMCKKIFASSLNQINNNFCESCFNFNILKRTIQCDLTNKIAVVTGGRVKIGYETAIRLLECNCYVIVTTRFVNDAIKRYQNHVNYEIFSNRLVFYPLDLRRKDQLDEFCIYLHTNYSKIDILIHNAAQTIRRPKEFYQHILSYETSVIKSICDTDTSSNNSNNSNSLILSNLESYQTHLSNVIRVLPNGESQMFPTNQLDKNNEQIDLRTHNTWIETMGNIQIEECVECMAINALAPFHLNQQLKSLLKNANGAYIINVSSMEGVFNWTNKSDRHPHTNMAKAALNMMTRTGAISYAKDKIYMVSVDTGWVTNEFPYGHNDFIHDAPLDNIDGACRILDPIFEYYNHGISTHGVFLKDYVIQQW